MLVPTRPLITIARETNTLNKLFVLVLTTPPIPIVTLYIKVRTCGQHSTPKPLFFPLCVVGTDSLLSISIGVILLFSFCFVSFLAGLLLLDSCCGEELSDFPPVGMVILSLLDFLPIDNCN